MTYTHKRYRIEGGGSVAEAQAAQDGDPRIAEILAAVRELRSGFQPMRRSAGEMIETYRKEIAGVLALRADLESMKSAIDATKSDIGSLRLADRRGLGVRRVAGELDAVAFSTETAASTILSAIEEIERQVAILQAELPPERQASLDIVRDRIVASYEACHFQDLIGQRITKVLGVMKFVEERLDNMIEAWSGFEVLKDFVGPVPAEERLLNGPALPGDADQVSQKDIDSLFA